MKVVPLRIPAFLTLLYFILLFIGAGLAFRERMLFIDAPHLLFRIINDGTFQITEHRFGIFITQVLPILGVKMNLPVYFLMIFYSLSFNIFYCIISCLLVFKFRNYSLVVLLAFYFSLFVSDTFYWTNNEIHEGVSWLFLTIGVTTGMAKKNFNFLLNFVVFSLLCYVSIWSHPLVMLLAIFLSVFLFLDGRYWYFKQSHSFLIIGTILLLSYLKYHQGVNHGYDGTKFEMLSNINLERLGKMLQSPQFGFFLNSCVTNYWLFVILFFCGIVSLIIEKKILLLLWTTGFTITYLFLICITYWDLAGNRFYIESEYMPMAVVACAPFVFFTLPRMKEKQGIFLLALIFAIRLVYIFNSHSKFSQRLVLMEQIKQKMKEKNLTKIAITGITKGAEEKLIMSWGAPVESLFLSKLDGDSLQRTFGFIDGGDANSVRTTGKDTLIGCWEKRSVANMNNHYFLIDTSVGYSVIQYDRLME